MNNIPYPAPQPEPFDSKDLSYLQRVILGDARRITRSELARTNGGSGFASGGKLQEVERILTLHAKLGYLEISQWDEQTYRIMFVAGSLPRTWTVEEFWEQEKKNWTRERTPEANNAR